MRHGLFVSGERFGHRQVGGNVKDGRDRAAVKPAGGVERAGCRHQQDALGRVALVDQTGTQEVKERNGKGARRSVLGRGAVSGHHGAPGPPVPSTRLALEELGLSLALGIGGIVLGSVRGRASASAESGFRN
jgi:hypothetical protein